MRLFITGATGLIGRRLVLSRLERGDQVVLLSRDVKKASNLFAADANPNVTVVEGDPGIPGDWQGAVDGCDAVIHLAGAGVADRRWSNEYKKVLENSRIDSTHQVVDAIRSASRRPSVLLNSSAVGFYGDTGSREAGESDPPGDDFLAELCIRWEAQATQARDLGVRTVILRTGVVLDDRGGSFREMIRPFRFFAGGTIGLGRQYVSWIHHRDMVGLIDLALRDASLEGPMNCTAPQPCRYRELAKAIGEALNRPSWLPVPKFVLRIVIGEFAKFATMSQRILPRVALEAGYQFLFPEIGPAVTSLVADLKRRKGRGQPSRMEVVYDSSAPGSGRSLAEVAAVPSPPDRPPPAAGPAERTRPKRDKPASRIRLIAIDVDGTLLRSDGRLAQGVIDACRAAERGGCLIVPATARPPRSMQSILQTLGTTGPSINYNGAVIWNPAERRSQYHEGLDPGLAREILERARAILPGVVVSVEIEDLWYVDHLERGVESESHAFDPDYVGPIEDVLDRPVTKLMFMADPASLGPVLDMVRTDYWSQRHVSVFLTDPQVIQIAHPMADKAIALQRIARRIGAAQDEVMAIGDGPNDAGMIEWAGFSVAVENASEIVRSLADVVVPSNDSLGVARAIQRYVLAAF